MLKIQIPEILIDTAINNDWVTSLVFFCRAKLLYHNNTIYQYTPYKLSALLKCSTGSVRYHIKVLSKQGLIARTNGNLTFKKIAGKHKSSIIIKQSDTLKEVTYKLYMKLLECNVRQQQWIISKKAEARKIRKKGERFSLRHLKSILKLEKAGLLEKPARPDVTLSLKNIALILGISPKTAIQVKKFAQNAGMATFINDTKEVCRLSLRTFNQCKDVLESKYGYLYWFKGMVLQPLPAKVVVNDYWNAVAITATNKDKGTFLSL